MISLLHEIEFKVVTQGVYEIYNLQALSSALTALVRYSVGPSGL